MSGVITFRHVAANAHTVVQGFGWKVLARCILAAIKGEKKTFLAIAFGA